MSLIPCKFYARNECRFGDNCRFYHAPRLGGGFQSFGGPFGGQRPAAPSTFGTQGQGKPAASLDTMIEAVKRDMLDWERGKIYPFSCYGPTGGKPCVPGFEDISPEELRCRFILNNKMPVDLSREVSTWHQCRQTYSQITPLIRNILERVIVKGEQVPGSALTSTTSSVFGSSAFIGSAQGNSMDVTNKFDQQRTNVFGGSTNVFGGGNTTVSSQPSLFGNSNSSTFGGSASAVTGGLFSTSSSFGVSATQKQPSTLFGTSPSFGSNSPPVQQASPFSPQTQQFQISFAGAAQQPTFQQAVSSTPTQQTSLFGVAPAAGNSPVQGSTPFAPGPFGNVSNVPQGQQQTVPTPTGTGNLFGTSSVGGMQAQGLSQFSNVGAVSQGGSSQVGGLFGTQLNATPTTSTSVPGAAFAPSQPQGTVNFNQKYIYSEESELTQEELNAFNSPEFTLDSIPVKPPPRNLCR